MSPARVSLAIRPELGLQVGIPLASAESPVEAVEKARSLPNGRYTARDAFGTLRMRLVVLAGEVKVFEEAR